MLHLPGSLCVKNKERSSALKGGEGGGRGGEGGSPKRLYKAPTDNTKP